MGGGAGVPSDVLLLPRLVAESRRVLPLHQQTMGPPPDKKKKRRRRRNGRRLSATNLGSRRTSEGTPAPPPPPPNRIVNRLPHFLCIFLASATPPSEEKPRSALL